MIEPTLVSEVRRLSVDDRYLLLEVIWESIEADQGESELTQEQKDELNRRLERHRTHPEEAMTWEQVQQTLHEKR